MARERLTQQRWHLSHRADPRGRVLADRHYNRQKVGAKQFVPPGRCCVLLTERADALWISSWPFGEYVQHGWPHAWVNSCFRNESPASNDCEDCAADVCEHHNLSSELIREAVAATRAFFGETPKQGMVTFVDADKTNHKRDPGRCYRKAGFKHVGFTQAGLWVFQLAPSDMPMALGAMPMIEESAA